VFVKIPPEEVLPLLLGLHPTLFSSMVGTVQPSQCSAWQSPQYDGGALVNYIPSLSVQVLVPSPPVEQVLWSLVSPTMWDTLSVLWPPSAMGTTVLPWRPSWLVCCCEVQMHYSTNTCKHLHSVWQFYHGEWIKGGSLPEALYYSNRCGYHCSILYTTWHTYMSSWKVK